VVKVDLAADKADLAAVRSDLAEARVAARGGRRDKDLKEDTVATGGEWGWFG
jgi:hypothetical protein